MKYCRKIALILGLALLFSPSALAAEDDPLAERSQALERAAGEYAPDVALDESIDLQKGLEDLLDTGAGQVKGILRTALKSGVLVLVIVLFCALAEGASQPGGKVFQAAPLVGVLAVCAVSVGDVHSLIGLGRKAIDAMASFAVVLLPTMTAAAAAAGAPAGAAARQMATVLFSDVLIQLISKVLIPLTYLYIAASAVFAAMGNAGIQRLAKTLKGVVVGVLTTVLVASVGYLSLSGAIAGTADAVSVKTAKMAISGMVPVVGGVLSDAAETVLAGAGVLRGTIGAFGTLVILSVCLTPFLQMGIHYLVYKLSATLSATVSQSNVVTLIDNIGGAFALVLGMTASCAMLLLFSVISCLNVVGVS